MSEYQTQMSSFIILQLKVNNKEKVDKHPSTDNSNDLDKESPKKKKKNIHGVQLFTQTWAFTVQSTTLLFQ